MYGQFLEFAGLRVAKAETAEDAIALARRELPTVIVMDYALPGIDGIEATRRLKADPETHAIPVVIVTGHAVEDRLQEARDAGANAVLTKPLLPLDLLQQIAPLLAVVSDSAPPHAMTTSTRKRRA